MCHIFNVFRSGIYVWWSRKEMGFGVRVAWIYSELYALWHVTSPHWPLAWTWANWSGCSEQAFIGSCTEPESQSFLWHPGNVQSCCLLCLVWKPSLSQGQGWTSHLREGVGCETAFILYHLCVYVNTQRHVKPATPILPKKKVVVKQVSDRKLESWEVVFFSAHLKMWNMNKMPVLCK